MSLGSEKTARILRADKDLVFGLEEAMRKLAGHNRVLEEICEENKKIIEKKLKILKVKNFSASRIYDSLIKKVKEDDKKIFKIFNRPVCTTTEGCRTLLASAKELSGVGKGFFLKEEKARGFLLNSPPKNILSFFGYKNAEELLEKENIFEIYSALRFVEDGQWLNNVFFRQYENLKPEDFEEREIRLQVLEEKWKRAAESFLKKKYHNISHLKELGIIFVIPLDLKTPGETLRTFGLILHYLHEVEFYSRLFRKYAKEENFSQKLISSLRGDVLNKRFSAEELGKKWLIVQRYLAKEDENDWRLFEPHINPEAVHWTKAENDIARLDSLARQAKLEGKFKNLELGFWQNLDWVGDFFPDETGVDVLMSFNLIDAVMSLVMEKEMIKYLYHHQEALWNKIFSEFVGSEKMEELIINNFDKGFINLEPDTNYE